MTLNSRAASHTRNRVPQRDSKVSGAGSFMKYSALNTCFLFHTQHLRNGQKGSFLTTTVSYDSLPLSQTVSSLSITLSCHEYIGQPRTPPPHKHQPTSHRHEHRTEILSSLFLSYRTHSLEVQGHDVRRRWAAGILARPIAFVICMCLNMRGGGIKEGRRGTDSTRLCLRMYACKCIYVCLYCRVKACMHACARARARARTRVGRK